MKRQIIKRQKERHELKLGVVHVRTLGKLLAHFGVRVHASTERYRER